MEEVNLIDFCKNLAPVEIGQNFAPQETSIKFSALALRASINSMLKSSP